MDERHFRRIEKFGAAGMLAAMEGNQTVLEKIQVNADVTEDYRTRMQCFQDWMLTMAILANTLQILGWAFP